MSVLHHFFVLAVLLTASLGFLDEAAAAQGGGQRPLDTEAIDAFVEEQMEARDLPGAAIAITKGDEVLHVRGYGETSTGRPVIGDTKFRVASLSKSFTSLAVMQLVEDGKVELDEPVEKYLPGFEVDDPRSGEITVRQLLDQSSGMADGGFPEISRPQPNSLRGAIERLREAKLVADPGTEWNYHNPNYQVAASRSRSTWSGASSNPSGWNAAPPRPGTTRRYPATAIPPPTVGRFPSRTPAISSKARAGW